LRVVCTWQRHKNLCQGRKASIRPATAGPEMLYNLPCWAYIWSGSNRYWSSCIACKGVGWQSWLFVHDLDGGHTARRNQACCRWQVRLFALYFVLAPYDRLQFQSVCHACITLRRGVTIVYTTNQKKHCEAHVIGMSACKPWV